MGNPNIKRNIRRLSMVALAVLGAVAIKEPTQTSDTHPTHTKAPLIKIYPVQETLDGGSIILGAAVKPSKSRDHIESASFSLTDPSHVPKGVSIRNNKMTATDQGEEVTAQFTAPSNLNQPKGNVEVQVTEVESNGTVSTAHEKIPYLPDNTTW